MKIIKTINARLIAIATLSLTVALSCNTTVKTNNVDEVSQKNTIEFKAYSFYELDDKYSYEGDSLKIKEWIIKKSKMIHASRVSGNLFDHNSGGPNGSEWNPSANLYLAIKYPRAIDLKELKVFVNDNFYENCTFEFENVMWYHIQKEYWEKELRKIDSVDIKKMYSEKYLSGIRNEDFYPSAKLDVGKVLKIDVRYNSNTKLTKYFHVTYGE